MPELYRGVTPSAASPVAAYTFSTYVSGSVAAAGTVPTNQPEVPLGAMANEKVPPVVEPTATPASSVIAYSPVSTGLP